MTVGHAREMLTRSGSRSDPSTNMRSRGRPFPACGHLFKFGLDVEDHIL